MFFTTRKNLFRQLFTTKLAKGIFCGIAACNILAGPGLVSAANRAGQAAEYDEWGLDYPGGSSTPAGTPALETPDDSAVPADSEVPATVPAPQAPTGGAVPQDVADSVGQTAVYVVVFFPEGEPMVIPGWIVDTRRRIVMTSNLLKGAEKIKVAFPQVTDVPDDKVFSSQAVVLKSDNQMNVAYLQTETMPEDLVNLQAAKPSHGQPAQNVPVVNNRPTPPTPPTHNGGGFNGGQQGGFNGGGQTGGGFNGGGQNGGFQRPAQQTNPLVGQWYLQDEVNGQQIQIAVVFNAQGQFALEMLMIDAYGQQNQYSNSGSYTVQGSTLTLNSNEGVEQSNFWFENGLLNVRMVADGTTLTFQPAS